MGKTFCHCEKSYSLKCLLLSTSWVLINWSYYFHSNCQKIFWTLLKCSLRLLIIDKFRKSLQLIFFHWKHCLFFKILCFQQFPRCYRNDPIASTEIVRPSFRPLKTFHWGLTHSIRLEKKGDNFFFAWTIAFCRKLVFSTTSYVLKTFPVKVPQ